MKRSNPKEIGERLLKFSQHMFKYAENFEKLNIKNLNCVGQLETIYGR